ncbi:MAG: hypothetical protein IPJ58_14920 [Ardenticatenia bacterium]|nr:hypothetical protein [Ardenticatenia bacterium]
MGRGVPLLLLNTAIATVALLMYLLASSTAPVVVEGSDRPSQTDPYEPNDAFQQAHGPVISGATYRAAISPASDYDYFYVQMPVIGVLEAVVDEANFSGELEMFNENHSNPFDSQSFYSGKAAWSHVRLPAGTFWIVVRRSSASGASTGPYRLRVFVPGIPIATPNSPFPTPGTDPYEPNDAFAQGYGPLVPGTKHLAAISPNSDHDVYVVQLKEVGDLEVVVDEATFSGQFELYNVDDQHRQFRSKSFYEDGPGRETVRLPAGTFWIDVSGSSSSGTGEKRYSLRAFYPAAPTPTPLPTARPTVDPKLLTIKSFLPWAIRPAP